MTTEVVVLNREADAIAADSAVTVSNPDPKDNTPKIYNTANKVFQLSPSEPIAIMVYGSAVFGPIPWETVVKEYRSRLGTATFETVEEYASDFIKSLSIVMPHYPLRAQGLVAWRQTVLEMMLLKNLEGDIKKLTASERRSRLFNSMNDRIKYLESCPCLDQISASVAGRQISSAIDDFKSLLGDVFEGLDIDRGIIMKARALSRLSLRSVYQHAWSSGIVVIGFGSSQLFPAFSHYVVDGAVAGKPRARHLNSLQIDEDRSADVCPFAQDDMIRVFLDGIDPTYPKVLANVVSRTFDLLSDSLYRMAAKSLSAADARTYAEELQKMRVSVLDDFEANLDQFLKDKHRAEIMSVVALLPKEGLADMAEALVSLTSLKRRMTLGAETVGGPIDVAVISKGDGLVWIKRKHYFPRELNVRYFERRHRLQAATNITEDIDDR